MQEKWHKLFRKLIENIDFPVDMNKLPLKARYRRRVRSGVAPEGWCHAPAGNAGERASLVGRGTFLRAASCRRGGEGRESEGRVPGRRFKSSPKSNRP